MTPCMMMMTETRAVNLALLFTGNPGALASERLPRETEAAKPAEELRKSNPSSQKTKKKCKTTRTYLGQIPKVEPSLTPHAHIFLKIPKGP